MSIFRLSKNTLLCWSMRETGAIKVVSPRIGHKVGSHYVVENLPRRFKTYCRSALYITENGGLKINTVKH